MVKSNKSKNRRNRKNKGIRDAAARAKINRRFETLLKERLRRSQYA